MTLRQELSQLKDHDRKVIAAFIKGGGSKLELKNALEAAEFISPVGYRRFQQLLHENPELLGLPPVTVSPLVSVLVGVNQ